MDMLQPAKKYSLPSCNWPFRMTSQQHTVHAIYYTRSMCFLKQCWFRLLSFIIVQCWFRLLSFIIVFEVLLKTVFFAVADLMLLANRDFVACKFFFFKHTCLNIQSYFFERSIFSLSFIIFLVCFRILFINQNSVYLHFKHTCLDT